MPPERVSKVHFKDLPRPPFLWTVDQVAQVLGVQLEQFEKRFVHYQDLTAGPVNPDYFIARNIAPLGDAAEWRISEYEVLRWMRRKGFRPRYNPMF